MKKYYLIVFFLFVASIVSGTEARHISDTFRKKLDKAYAYLESDGEQGVS